MAGVLHLISKRDKQTTDFQGMDSKIKKAFLVKYLKEDALKGRGAWPREMKLFNGLALTYPDSAFWTWYNPGFKLNSLAWFVGEGKGDLATAHKAYLFDLQSRLDNLSKTRKVDDEKVTTILPPNTINPTPKTLSSWLKKR